MTDTLLSQVRDTYGDHNVDGVPASGAKEPSKAAIRALWFTAITTFLADAGELSEDLADDIAAVADGLAGRQPLSTVLSYLATATDGTQLALRDLLSVYSKTEIDAALGDTASTAVATPETNGLMAASDKVKLNGVAAGATANDTDANLKNRANHTGTQSADTLTDGSNNKVYTAAEKTKLGGVASGATANDTDANLKNRANHTGTQAQSTIDGLPDALSTASAGIAANKADLKSQRGVYNYGDGLSRPDAIGGVHIGGGVYPQMLTEAGLEAWNFVAVPGLRSLEYHDLLGAITVAEVEKQPDGSIKVLRRWKTIEFNDDLSIDFVPGDRTKSRMGVGLTPPAGMFAGDAGAPGPSVQLGLWGGRRYRWNAVAGSLTAVLDAPIDGHLSYGQSNAENGGLDELPEGARVATVGVIDRHRGLMLNTGYLGTKGVVLDPATLTDLVPGQEAAVPGESGGASFQRKLLADIDAIGLPQRGLVYRSAGQSGQTIAVLSKAGTPYASGAGVPYANLIATVRRLREIAALYGVPFRPTTYGFRQGEADADIPTVEATYLAALAQVEFDIRTDIAKETGVEPWMILLPLIAPDAAARNMTPITRAQMSALDLGVRIAPSCAPYWFTGSYGLMGVHWTPQGKAHLLEYEARAARIVREAMAFDPGARLGDTIERAVYNGTAWVRRRVPFEPAPRTIRSTVQRVGSTITGEVAYAEGGLSVWTGHGRGAAVNNGFAWSGPETITGVAVSNAGARPKWTVSFGSAPSPGFKLSYAFAEQANITDGGADCWGDLFDNCLEPSTAVPDRTLRQGMLPDEFQL